MAMKLAESMRDEDNVRISMLCERLILGLADAVPGAVPVGDRSRSVPHCVSVTFDGISGETFVSRLARAGIAVSLGSACHGDPAKPSHVLTAAGLTAAEARRTVRFGIGRFTTDAEIDYTVSTISEMYGRRG